jgi:predicted nucleic acid-binding protein
VASVRKARKRTNRPAGRVSEQSPTYGSTIYVESSALLAALLESDIGSARALNVTGPLLASAITFAEAHRGIVRARSAGRINVETEAAVKAQLATIARRCELVPVSDEILARAGRPFPVEPVRTLDAIHLATLEVLDLRAEALRVVTRDERIAANASAMGYRVLPQ